MAAMGSAAAAPQGIPPESAPIADSGTGSATGSAQLLLKCLSSGSSVAPGDSMGFPALCR
ncbi:hypothetical protein [Nocardia acidivorans]|uniref:hypothetical protein n=1 Tax=Nocardia acidivorans TaxID=404580 RepID=UPI000A773123|nr:hypothetical protein [Nocardia acidivorans]